MITMLVPNGSVFELVERHAPILREEDQKHSTEKRALGEVRFGANSVIRPRSKERLLLSAELTLIGRRVDYRIAPEAAIRRTGIGPPPSTDACSCRAVVRAQLALSSGARAS
jgi:hypothetical protein